MTLVRPPLRVAQAVGLVGFSAAISVALGCLLMSGLIAAVSFPMMKALAPRLPDYPIVFDDHWKIAAGYPAAVVFYAASGVQTLMLLVAGACRLGASTRSLTTRALIGTSAIFGGLQLFVIVPMAAALIAYRAAARAGELAQAIESQLRFQQLHVVSTGAMMLLALLYIVCLGCIAYEAMQTARASAG